MAVEQMALQTAIRPAVDRAEPSDRSIALAYAVAKRGLDILGAVFGLLMLLGQPFRVLNWMARRLAVKPGMYRPDVAHVAQASLQLDLSILLHPVPVVLGRDGAA